MDLQENDFIIIFDTETTSIDKPFLYDLGYIIAMKQDNGQYLKVTERNYIIEQTYNNKMLFQSAYYSKKRPLYTALLRGRKAKMTKLGHAFRGLRADIEKFNITIATAFNSPFDKRVMEFNSNFFGLINPMENLEIFDIMGIFRDIHTSDEYAKFCEDNGYYNKASGWILTNAETTYRFITQDKDFIESHTALDDSNIELEIMNYAIAKGAKLEQRKKAFVEVTKPINSLTIKRGEKTYNFKYRTRKNRKNGVIDLSM